MTGYICKVMDAQGTRREFTRQGPSAEAVARDLSSQGYFIVGMAEEGARGPARGRRLPAGVVIDFTETLALFLGNGLTLKEALQVAVEVFSGARHRELFQSLSDRIQKGDSLHQGLGAWKTSFPPLYLGLVQIGEKTGDLVAILGRLTGFLTTQKELRDKTANALTYPLLVVAVAVIGLTLLLTLVFPTLTAIIGSLNQKAAAGYARNIQGFQTGALGFLVLSVLLGTGAGVLARARKAGGPLRLQTDRLLWDLPGVGTFVRSSFGLNFSFAMETLLSGGYSLEQALAEGAGVVTNTWARSRILEIRDRVVSGVTLSRAFQETGAFPEALVGWLRAGERSHDMEKSFAHLFRYYKHRQDQYQTRFLALVEPVMILLVGTLLVFIILTFITPVFSMLGNLLN